MLSQEKMARISATIPESVVEQLRLASKEERRSMSAQLTLLIEEGLKRRNEKRRDNHAVTD